MSMRNKYMLILKEGKFLVFISVLQHLIFEIRILEFLSLRTIRVE